MTTIKPATLEHSFFALLENPAIGSAASLLGRLMISALFLVSGIGKITAPAATIGYIASAGLPLPQLGLAIAIAIAVELILVPALALGYRTRSVAPVIAAYSVATALFFHRGVADPNQFLHFLKNIAIAGGLLQIVGFGPGRFSLDAWFQHRVEAIKH
ncbi:MAG: putative rane protein [Gammaproteobacteria bacterium]|jgi:putative oxidoreductase|nr:putative rane protein [Gammaproteobacteria bacterium]